MPCAVRPCRVLFRHLQVLESYAEDEAEAVDAKEAVVFAVKNPKP